MHVPRPSLFLHLLMRRLGEGASFAEATDWALEAVQEAYGLIKESVLGAPAIESPVSAGRRRADAA
jgi:hypothetical protein